MIKSLRTGIILAMPIFLCAQILGRDIDFFFFFCRNDVEETL